MDLCQPLLPQDGLTDLGSESRLGGLPRHCGCMCGSPAQVEAGEPCIAGQTAQAPHFWKVASLSQHLLWARMRTDTQTRACGTLMVGDRPRVTQCRSCDGPLGVRVVPSVSES